MDHDWRNQGRIDCARDYIRNGNVPNRASLESTISLANETVDDENESLYLLGYVLEYVRQITNA